MLRKVAVIGLSSAIGFLAATSAWAQKAASPPSAGERMAHLEGIANYGKMLKQNMGDKTRCLSSGGQFIVNLGERWNEIKPMVAKALEGRGTLEEKKQGAMMLGKSLAPVGGNNLAPVAGNNQASADDNLSNFAGNVQSEASAAWWGANAIVGFNDSGSYIRTLLFPGATGNFSFTGWCSSANANVALPTQPTWVDRGPLIAPCPVGGGWRDSFGDPVCKAARPTDFYFATAGLDTRRDGIYPSIIVFSSTNGGVSFPVCTAAAAVNGNAFPYSVLDKPDMDVKPGGTHAADIVHVVYASLPGYPYTTASIQYVRSANGGATWSAPVTIASASGWVYYSNFVQFARVVQQQGTNNVYITWEDFEGSFGSTRTLNIRKSTDNGVSWGSPITIGPVTPVGDGYALDYLQGIIRAGMDFSGLAVNPANGHVYICYHQGEFTQPDAFGNGGVYEYSGIYFRRSIDGGATWSGPIRVNTDTAATPFDQFQPGMAVSNSGKIIIVFYDRRNSVYNFNMQVETATSTNDGATWTNVARTGLFGPLHHQDYFVNDVYMGDYNYPANDRSNANTTDFIVPFTSCTAGNQDVFIEKEN